MLQSRGKLCAYRMPFPFLVAFLAGGGEWKCVWDNGRSTDFIWRTLKTILTTIPILLYLLFCTDIFILHFYPFFCNL